MALRTRCYVGFVLVTCLVGFSAPSDKPQPSQNLLNDPSFEGVMPPSGLPEGWSRWGMGNQYTANIVDGGYIGKKCLKIEGDGTRGVVFANGIKIDRDKRYVLRGWAKFEGDPGGRALILFHYFRDGNWLGLPDTVGVTLSQKGWQRISKTDRAVEVPDATAIWVSCTLEGKGTAWFDDVELVAYDRKGLPEDFETRFGSSNAASQNVASQLSVLQRWIGIWDTQVTINPGDWFPQGHKSERIDTVEWVLGGKFVQRKTRNLSGDSESLRLIIYDTQAGIFRAWHFDSAGNFLPHPRGEAIMEWNPESTTLSHKMTDPWGGNMRGTERFVGSDRIEMHLVFRDKDGNILMESNEVSTRHK